MNYPTSPQLHPRVRELIALPPIIYAKAHLRRREIPFTPHAYPEKPTQLFSVPYPALVMKI